MVHAEKQETSGTPFLNKSVIKDKGVKAVTIETEPIYVDVEFEGKPQGKRLECIVSTDVLDPVKCKWQMNPTTSNFLIDEFGSDTEKWIGKKIELAVKQAGSASPGVYPKDCSLEKVLA